MNSLDNFVLGSRGGFAARTLHQHAIRAGGNANIGRTRRNKAVADRSRLLVECRLHYDRANE